MSEFSLVMRFETNTPFASLTGRDVRVAIVDSGVNPAHPHVAGVAGGVCFSADGESLNYLDYIGHGTAVAGAVREKAPGALLYAIKVFDQHLRTNSETIVRAIEWAIENDMDIVNLSLGTVNESHCRGFEQVVSRAAERNVVLVAPREMNDRPSLPGCLPSVIGVALDCECPLETYRCVITDSRPLFFASGYPRAIPGAPPERNLAGISFAVANLTGFVTRAKQAFLNASSGELERILIEACA